MNSLQAAMKDKSASTWRERKTMYKVGSPMKGCHHCGDVQVEESGKKRYLSGFQIFRSYRPWDTKWTYCCWECGAKDAACWEGAWDLGREPILGSRDAVKAVRLERRRDREKEIVPREKLDRIAQLRAIVKELKKETYAR